MKPVDNSSFKNAWICANKKNPNFVIGEWHRVQDFGSNLSELFPEESFIISAKIDGYIHKPDIMIPAKLVGKGREFAIVISEDGPPDEKKEFCRILEELNAQAPNPSSN